MPMRKATVPGGASAVIRPASAVLLIVVLLSVATRRCAGATNVDTGNMDTTAREVDTVNMLDDPGAARRYHHGNLRAALIDTAVDQARAGGSDAVVLREAARRT